jgi:hypothetical protein
MDGPVASLFNIGPEKGIIAFGKFRGNFKIFSFVHYVEYRAQAKNYP